ncbi:MAG: hypothetical protein ACREO4_00680 [Lysobacter sp.]
MEWRWIGLLTAFLAAPVVATATPLDPSVDTCSEAYAALPHGSILDLLDPDAPSDRRSSALEAYERLAGLEACPEFGYTLGLLYRHGPYLPGNLVPQDLEKARGLILAMAEDGYLPAYADLAEMEMRHANAREAMKWTQVYLYFTRTVRNDYLEAGDMQYQRSAYNGNLLARVEAIWRWKRPPRRLVREDLAAYLADHGVEVARRMKAREEGMHRRASGTDLAPAQLANDPDPCYVDLDDVGAASAAWIVEVLPSGKTGRVVLENFVPHIDAADAIRTCLLQRQFAAFDGAQSVTTRVHFVVGSTEGASLRRLRRR